MNLDWVIENRTVPIEVTNALEEVANHYRYTVDEMHQHKQNIMHELRLQGKSYIVKFLFPSGMMNNERWIHALIRMEIRRFRKIYPQN